MLKDGRMAAICAMVREGAVVCDVGTDHAIIPAELLKSGRCRRAVITDISAASLEKGIKNIQKQGLSERTSAFLADGTVGVNLDDVTDVIIAGMGGELITGIISRDERLKTRGMRLVLQPMSRAHLLRAYLSENGFSVLREVKAVSGRRVYAVINAEYTGKAEKTGIREMYLGKYAESQNEAERGYAEKELQALTARLTGINASDKSAKYAAEREEVLEIIEEIQKFLRK